MNKEAQSDGAVLEGWRFAGIAWGSLLLLIFWLFWDVIVLTIEKWWTNEAFTHAFLIIPISVWLSWQRLEELKLIVPRPSIYGLVAMFGAGVIWMVGWLADTAIVQQFALVILIQGSVLAIFGTTVVRALLFPLFFLVFAVPAGDEIVPALQQFTAAFVVKGIELTGIPVYWDGIFISIPKGDFEVAETCSGIRFLIATVALGSLFANISFQSWKRRLAVMALAIVIPIIANGFRAYGIVMIAHLSDMKYAVGADHIIFGWVFFSFVLILLIAIGRTFSDQELGDYVPITGMAKNQSVTTSRSALLRFGIAGAVVAAVFPLYAGSLSSSSQADIAYNIRIAAPEHWRTGARQSFRWSPRFEGAGGESVATFQRGERTATVYVAYYGHQRPGAELIQFNNTVAGNEPWGISRVTAGETTIAGNLYPLVNSRIVAGRFSRTVWHWYWVDGTVTTNRYVAKLLSAKAKLKGGGRGAAVLVISVPDSGIGGNSSDELAEIANELGPIDAFFETTVGALQAIND